MRILFCLSVAFLSLLRLAGTNANAQQPDVGPEAVGAQPVIQIDLSTLSPDILKCNVCRMRLGLRPIPGGGTLDAAEHDAQAQQQAAQANEIQQNDESKEGSVEIPQSTGKPSVSQAANKPEATQQRKLEGHNLESNPSLSLKPESKLEQFNSPSEATRFSTGDQSSITLPSASNTKLNSPTAIQIELELAKRQLADRNTTIENFNRNQSQLESKIAELTLANKQYAASLNSQSSNLENLNAQLRQQTSDSATQLNQVQQELEAAKRELSVAIANQKQSADDLAKSTNTQIAELNTRLKNAEKGAEEYRGQADTLRRQRDGFERELQIAKGTPKAKIPEESRDINVMQGLLEKTQRELGEARNSKETLEKKVSDLEQQIDKGKKSSEEVDSLRIQLEQQAAKFLASEAAWDAEKAGLLKKIPKSPATEDRQATKVPDTTSQVVAPRSTIADPLLSRQGNADKKADGQSTDSQQPANDVKDDSPASPFRAGPKMKSRAPRQSKDEGAARREL